MEASSIITQVSRDEEHLNSYATEKGNLAAGDSPIEPINPAAPPQQQQQQRSTAAATKSFFRSLFCCLRQKKPKSKHHGEQSPERRPFREEGKEYLLGPLEPPYLYRKCMVIDLDETLVHSSFKPISNADFVVPVDIDGTTHQVYVLKRPHVDEFLLRMGELYECILFTASLSKYADPVSDLLDPTKVFRKRLFRESCVFYRGNYVKDLNRLGRDLAQVVIVDNSPASYIFHPDNAVPVASWFDDVNDSELLDLIPFFEKLANMDNVYTVLCNSNHPYNNSVPHSNGPTNHSQPILQNNHSPPKT